MNFVDNNFTTKGQADIRNTHHTLPFVCEKLTIADGAEDCNANGSNRLFLAATCYCMLPHGFPDTLCHPRVFTTRHYPRT